MIQKAVDKQLLSFNLTSVFNYVDVKERVDAPTFGHRAGMLLRPDVLEKAFEEQDAAHGKSFKIFLSPETFQIDAETIVLLA